MDTDESPASNLSYLPRFSQPSSRFPSPEPGQNPGDSPETAISPSEPKTRKPGQGDTRTATSSIGDVKKPTVEQSAALVAGLIGLVLVGVTWAVRQRSRRKLRQPTKREVNDVAEPIGAILLRHVDLTLFGPDIADVIKAGAGIGNYLNAGPLLEGTAIDTGVPADLNQPEETP